MIGMCPVKFALENIVAKTLQNIQLLIFYLIDITYITYNPKIQSSIQFTTINHYNSLHLYTKNIKCCFFVHVWSADSCRLYIPIYGEKLCKLCQPRTRGISYGNIRHVSKRTKVFDANLKLVGLPSTDYL